MAMNLKKERLDLVKKVEAYLYGRIPLENLADYAWNVIERFKSVECIEPFDCDLERSFWHTIWQIQHLADENHENDGLTRPAFLQALRYMKREEEMPEDAVGRRP